MVFSHGKGDHGKLEIFFCSRKWNFHLNNGLKPVNERTFICQRKLIPTTRIISQRIIPPRVIPPRILYIMLSTYGLSFALRLYFLSPECTIFTTAILLNRSTCKCIKPICSSSNSRHMFIQLQICIIRMLLSNFTFCLQSPRSSFYNHFT